MRRCFAGSRGERSRSPSSRAQRAPGTPEASSATAALPSSNSSRSLASNDSVTHVRAPALHVLYASPLDPWLPQLNIQAEIDLMNESLRRARCSMNICVGIATTKALAQLLTLSRAEGNVILHLSAHIVTQEQNTSGTSLVLENSFGGPHCLSKQQLKDLLGSDGQLDGLSLVFLNGCKSEILAQVLVESGCRLVVATRGKVHDVAAATFTQQFYYELGLAQSVRASFESAQQVLRVDPDPRVKSCAEMFVLFGQRHAGSTAISREAHANRFDMDSPRSQYSLSFENSLDGLAPACSLPPRVEDYIERSPVLCHILSQFDSSGGSAPRRACVLSGPAGIGKTSLAIELAHFATAPGRLFSRSVMFVTLQEGRPEFAKVLGSVAQCLASRQPPLLSISDQSQEEVLRALERLDQLKGRHLIILDDHSGAVRACPEVQGLLSNMLKVVKNLSILVCSRQQVYASLGSCKLVNVALQPLSNMASAKLFSIRIHRPLRPCDLERGAACQENLLKTEHVLPKLMEHPLLVQLGGNPQRIRDTAEHVTPDLHSLFDLCSSGAASSSAGSALLRNMSVDETEDAGASSLGTAAPGGLTGTTSSEGAPLAQTEGAPLARTMSVDGAPLARMMSVDGAPLTRMMSIDET